MQGCEVGDRDQVTDDLAIDAHRCRIARPAVHHAVPDRFDALHAANGRRELRLVEPSLRHLELAIDERPIVVVDQAHLERAGTGIEDEDAQ